MRISELARQCDLPVATVKFYLREGLLQPGEATSATQAQYGDEHVARLGLVRALLGTGGLSVATARTVLQVLDDPATNALDALGAAHCAVGGEPTADRPDLSDALAHVRRWGWSVYEDTPALANLARGLETLHDAGFDVTDDLLDRYARAAGELGKQDVADMPTTSAADAVRFVVLGTLLLEPILLALRRLAQEDAAVGSYAAREW